LGHYGRIKHGVADVIRREGDAPVARANASRVDVLQSGAG